jgi:hypothetical protein
VSSSSARHEMGKKESNSVLPFSPGSLPSQGAMPRMFSQVERATRMAKARSMFGDYQYLTEREAERRQLAIEIANLETLIEKASAQEMRESAQRDGEYLFSMNSGRMSINSDPVDSSMHGTRRTTGGTKKRGLFDTSKLCEIATLQWPMLFGEACVIDPDGGLSRGTIVADTTCDIFVIHKSQMQTFHIEKDFIDNIQQKSVSYPDDTVLVASLAKKEGWMKLREAMLAEIPKGRWPSRADDVEPMVF